MEPQKYKRDLESPCGAWAKRRKASVIPWGLNRAQSDPVLRLLQACDSRKKSFKPLCPALKCQLSHWIFWPQRLKGASGLSAAGGGSAVVHRSGVWLCKRRGRLHGGQGLLAAPFRLSHTAWGSLDIKSLVTMRETDPHFRQLKGRKWSAEMKYTQEMRQKVVYTC